MAFVPQNLPSSPAPDSAPPFLPNPTSLIILHPGYRDGCDVMFRLKTVDCLAIIDERSEDGDRVIYEWGMSHATVLTICSIVACNKPGFLSPIRLPSSQNQAGRASALSSRPTIQANPVLTASSYYFYLFDWPSEIPYPVCPNFQNWMLPHEMLPTDWTIMVRPSPTSTSFHCL